jgi:hypothetical protein
MLICLKASYSSLLPFSFYIFFFQFRKIIREDEEEEREKERGLRAEAARHAEGEGSGGMLRAGGGATEGAPGIFSSRFAPVASRSAKREAA